MNNSIWGVFDDWHEDLGLCVFGRVYLTKNVNISNCTSFLQFYHGFTLFRDTLYQGRILCMRTNVLPVWLLLQKVGSAAALPMLNLPFVSNLNNVSKYKADVEHSMMSLISNSLKHIKST
jgi:hypothetical protein